MELGSCYRKLWASQGTWLPQHKGAITNLVGVRGRCHGMRFCDFWLIMNAFCSQVDSHNIIRTLRYVKRNLRNLAERYPWLLYGDLFKFGKLRKVSVFVSYCYHITTYFIESCCMRYSDTCHLAATSDLLELSTRWMNSQQDRMTDWLGDFLKFCPGRCYPEVGKHYQCCKYLFSVGGDTPGKYLSSTHTEQSCDNGNGRRTKSRVL